MTSGEWDLRALKALEEEEQKEFLALSQKSLFEPPSPPGGSVTATASSPSTAGRSGNGECVAAGGPLLISKLLQQQQNTQLYPHLLKLPTIDECNFAARRQQHSRAGSPSSARLKFTKALSLSAHSLTGRAERAAAFAGEAKTGRSFGSFVGFGRKHKPKLVNTKSSGSLSPSHYNNSPVYTPPPIRRCATLHHTQPVRKTFKTLQQLEKQKQERKREGNAAKASYKSASPQLQRVAGTNKTYWKYGANSTAASIIGQRTHLLKQGKLLSCEVESNTSDELGSDAAPTPSAGVKLAKGQTAHEPHLSDFDDSATETGSCTVPLNTDSIEMMRLMLTAATTAVNQNYPLHEEASGLSYAYQDIATAATSGGGAVEQHQHGYNKYHNSGNTILYNPSAAVKISPLDETVAYEAFHNMTRRKSFSGRQDAIMRANSLQSGEEQQQFNKAATLARHVDVNSRDAGNRKMLKASSIDTPSALKYVVSEGAVGAERNGLMQRSTIITNPIVESIKTSAPTTHASMTIAATNHMSNLMTTTTTATTTATATTKTARTKAGAALNDAALVSVDGIGVGLHFNDETAQSEQQQYQHETLLHHHHHHHQQQQQQHQQQHQQHLASMLCHDIGPNNCRQNSPSMPQLPSSSATSSHIMDDELEQHIKHCSCSCNHMGYGNSMDYQVSPIKSLHKKTHAPIAQSIMGQSGQLLVGMLNGQMGSLTWA